MIGQPSYPASFLPTLVNLAVIKQALGHKSGQSRCDFCSDGTAVEESIINAMIATETMTGIENHKVTALPYDQLRAVLKKYSRLTDQ